MAATTRAGPLTNHDNSYGVISGNKPPAFLSNAKDGRSGSNEMENTRALNSIQCPTSSRDVPATSQSAAMTDTLACQSHGNLKDSDGDGPSQRLDADTLQSIGQGESQKPNESFSATEKRPAIQPEQLDPSVHTTPPSTDPSSSDAKLQPIKQQPPIGQESPAQTIAVAKKLDGPLHKDSSPIPSKVAPRGMSGATPVPEPPDDPDSEDDEYHSLIAAKKKQIEADVVAYRRRMDLELVIYENRLRGDLARKRMKKEREAGLAKPKSQYKGYGYKFLPLLDSAEATHHQPTSSASSSSKHTVPPVIRRSSNDITGSQAERDSNHSSHHASRQLEQPARPMTAEAQSTPRSTTPPRAPSPPATTQTTPPPVSPSSSVHPAPAPQRLSVAAINHFNRDDKPTLPLPSSLRSTSSWSSTGGKHSRKSSLVDSPKKKKRVIFQLTTEDGDWLKIRPDGEEIPLSDEEKDRLRIEAAATEEMEEAERLGNRGDIFGGPLMRSGSSDITLPSPILSRKGSKPPPHGGAPTIHINAPVPASQSVQKTDDVQIQPAKVSAQVQTTSEPIFPDDLLEDSYSDDSLGEDVFDLDEEIPFDYSNPTKSFPVGPTMEESISSLELPLAPDPPSLPGGSATSPSIFGVRRSNSDKFKAGWTAPSGSQSAVRKTLDNLPGSYISGSLPLSSYSLVNPVNMQAPYTSPSLALPSKRPSSTDEKLQGPSTSKQKVHWIPPPAASAMASTTLSPTVELGIRRRSISKYGPEIPEEPVTGPDGSATAAASDTESKTSATAVPHRKVTVEDEEAAFLLLKSPYGQSAPIAMTRLSPGTAKLKASSWVEDKTLPPAKSSSVRDGLQARSGIFTEQPILNGGVGKQKVLSGLESLQLGSVNTEALNSVIDDIAAAKSVVKSGKAPAANVKIVLKATTEALAKNSLPSSLPTSKTRKANIGAQWDIAHDNLGRENLEVSKTRKVLPSPLPLNASNPIVQQFPFLARSGSGTEPNVPLSASNPFGPSLPSSTFYTQNPITNTVMNSSKSPISAAFSRGDRERMVIPVNSPPYFSEAARNAAESSDVDVDESIVGGLDGGTGLDATSLRRASLGLAKTSSLAKSLEKSGIKPDRMSFSLRMALEDN